MKFIRMGMLGNNMIEGECNNEADGIRRLGELLLDDIRSGNLDEIRIYNISVSADEDQPVGLYINYSFKDNSVRRIYIGEG